MTKGSAGRGSTARKNTTTLRPFKDFHAEWIASLRSTLLPLLRHSLSSSASSDGGGGEIVVSPLSGGALVSSSSDLLSSHSSAVLHHFQAYYRALDLAAAHDPSQLLAPHPWRSPVEIPFLWFGDFHPSLFTNLLRSLSPPQTLIPKIQQLERGIRLMAPSILAKFRDAQAQFVERIAGEWAASKGKDELSEEAITTQMEELESVFGDANRLRRSILGEIVGAADVYQGAVFLKALAEFVVGFWDPDLLQEFDLYKEPSLSPSREFLQGKD